MDDNNIIELTGEDGEEYEFEILAYTKEKGRDYAILYPLFGPTEVFIVEVKDGPTPDTCTYEMVDDPYLLKLLYQRFKDSNPEGISFED